MGSLRQTSFKILAKLYLGRRLLLERKQTHIHEAIKTTMFYQLIEISDLNNFVNWKILCIEN